MSFIAWLIALPTALVLFLFPVPQEAQKVPEIASTSPQVQVIGIALPPTPSAKERVTEALGKANIPVYEIPVTIPSQPAPAAPVAPGNAIINPMPEEPAPEAPVAIATAIEATYISPRPLYSGCSVAPTLQYKIVVKDQNDDPMFGKKVTYVGSAANNPSGEFLATEDNTFNYTDKSMKEIGVEGEVSLTFSVGDISISTKQYVIPAPTDPANRPAWCD